MKRPALAGKFEVEDGYKNDLERGVGQQLAEAGISFDYEGERIPYEVPARTAHYIPDFRPHGSRIRIESKGRFGGYTFKGRAATSDPAKERKKLILLKAQHPELDIRIVFQRASNKISKTSKTTYADWAAQHGFRWSDKGIVPQQWLDDIKQEQELNVNQPQTLGLQDRPTRSRRK